MNRDDDTILAEAMRWHANSDSDAMDWDGFTAWLEADARHRRAYDEVALTDAALAEHRFVLSEAAPAPANDEAVGASVSMPSRASWKCWAGVAIAASLVAVLAVPQFLAAPAQTYRTVEASRRIALEDGSSVILAPHSSLTIEGRAQDRMALNGGAWFDIRHDPSRSLAIRAGGVEISDIGTRFDVQAAADRVRVEVAEGTVSVESDALATPIRLGKGRGLQYDAKVGTAVVQAIGADSIGEWRSGRLSFASAPLALVAADLSRYAGVDVAVAPGLGERPFSGTLVIGDGEAALRDLSQVMGLELRRSGTGFVLAASR